MGVHGYGSKSGYGNKEGSKEGTGKEGACEEGSGEDNGTEEDNTGGLRVGGGLLPVRTGHALRHL